MRTLGRRIIHLDPARGFAAETVAAGVLYTTAFVFEAPISTTHTITSAVMGAGATKRFSAVRWGVARSIVAAWVLTFPMAGLRRVVYWSAASSSSSPDAESARLVGCNRESARLVAWPANARSTAPPTRDSAVSAEAAGDVGLGGGLVGVGEDLLGRVHLDQLAGLAGRRRG